MSDFSQNKLKKLSKNLKDEFTLRKLNKNNEIELSKFDTYKNEIDRCLINLMILMIILLKLFLIMIS